ncbi:hypothetical protein [Xenorhabdus stockiae]|uniref:hypothetical protein n=1 Tax=Xenorhabdus stockiae TaxID=351614 RepID=UPI004062BBB2
MKVLFGIVLIALSLIVKPVLADQAFQVDFASIPPPYQFVTLVKAGQDCMYESGPDQISITPSIVPINPIYSSINIRDKNSSKCFLVEKK